MSLTPPDPDLTIPDPTAPVDSAAPVSPVSEDGDGPDADVDTVRSDPCGLSGMARRLSQLKEKHRQLLASREATEDKFDSQMLEESQARSDALKKLKDEFQAEIETGRDRFEERKSLLREKCRRRMKMVENAYASSRKVLLGRLRDELDAHQKELNRTKERLVDEQRAKAVPAAEQQTRFVDDVISTKSGAAKLLEEIARFADGLGVHIETGEAPLPPDVGRDEDLEAAAEDAGRVLQDATRALESFKRSACSTAARDAYIGLAYFLDVLFHSGLAYLAIHLGFGLMGAGVAAASLLVVGVLIHVLRSVARRKSCSLLQGLHDEIRALVVRAEHLREEGAKLLDPDRFLDEHIDRVMAFDKKANEFREARRAACQEAVAELDRRHAKVKKKVDAFVARVTKDGEREWPEEEARLQAAYKEDLARVEVEHSGKAAEREKAKAIKTLEDEWRDKLSAFAAFCGEAESTCRTRHPSWDDPAWADRPSPVDFPSALPVGVSRVNVRSLVAGGSDWPPAGEHAEIALPMTMSFPVGGSLFVHAGGEGRARALDIVRDAALRILTSFPPGMAKLTIVDPVGLGESFSDLMRLADYDEALVDGRIWTEIAHIEKRLSGLTQHIEKVIQKYLRNQYATIEEYNLQAGEMKEAYRFLIVADFPSGFSDLGLERIASIVSSGPRCGVHTLMLCDSRQQLPPELDPGLMRRNGLVLEEGPGGFVANHAGARLGVFSPEAPPDPELTARLLERTGQAAQEAERVEVPFASVAPADEEVWSLKTDAGLRIPVGKSGVDKLRHLDLGRGTAQHALVGGRTGSGKSNLFHVIINSAALWYSPSEMEFYLIDFKKGVEFKTFATNHLPHARVIAIESDREFGLSVLQRIDRELQTRGELFRKKGVQDLAAYRARGGEVNLPRQLLIIDEFQEFFTEDDTVARDAALLLDRFVRQGRAFGIHAVLGSQTLSGIYTLAKSTLGQIGVRVALQCNEADSHLIFGEDNPAARLLARPGEAIYNDMSGLVEGNDPFQVVWLPEAEEEENLVRIAERAKEKSWRPETPPVVFEGNAPAEFTNNLELSELLDRPFQPEDAKPRAWLGEPNAIKGPTEAHFVRAGGGNLLVVGQHREAAFATVCATVIGLAARHEPGSIRMVVLNGGGNEEYTERLGRLADALPHNLEIVEPRNIPVLMDELGGMATAEDDDGDDKSRPRVFVFVFGIQRFRKLRQDEDAMFSLDREESTPPSQRFADVLRDGPERGIHSVVWCDSLGNLNRTFSRKTMREFDMRVLFQMSASDSSELIDATTANDLGLHGALLAIESDGTMEKFRPYTVPSPDFIEDLGKRLRARHKRAIAE